jgi:hypothetical protein
MSDLLKVETITNIEQLESLRSIWNLFSIHPSTDLDYFLRVTAFKKNFLSPYIFVAKYNDKPVELLVGHLEKTILHLRLGYTKLLGIPIKQITVLCHGSENLYSSEIATALVDAIIRRLKSHHADMAILWGLLQDSALYVSARRLPNILMRDHVPEIYPRWRLILPESFESFIARHRHSRRVMIKQLEKVGTDIEYKFFSRADETSQFFAIAEKIASRSYQRRLGGGFLNNEHDHRQIRNAADKGWWRAWVLFVKDQPVAFWSGELYVNVFYGVWTAYDPLFRDYAVGNNLLFKLISDMCEQKVYAIDFDCGTAQYKERYCNEYLQGAAVRLYAPTFRGLCANLLNSSSVCMNTSINSFLKRIGIINKIKGRIRKWKVSKINN